MVEERRINAELTESELYKININREIKRERREAQLEKMIEVQQQKRIWKYTFSFCLLLNLTLLAIGLIGSFK